MVVPSGSLYIDAVKMMPEACDASMVLHAPSFKSRIRALIDPVMASAVDAAAASTPATADWMHLRVSACAVTWAVVLGERSFVKLWMAPATVPDRRRIDRPGIEGLPNSATGWEGEREKRRERERKREKKRESVCVHVCVGGGGGGGG